MEAFFKTPNTVYFISVAHDGSQSPITLKRTVESGYTLHTDDFTCFIGREAAEEALRTLRSNNVGTVFYLEKRVSSYKKKDRK